MDVLKRRSFLGTLVGGISAAVGAIMAVPLFRFAAWPMFHKGGGADWFALGKADAFSGDGPVRTEIEVRKTDGWRVSTAKQTVYVTRAGGKLQVLSAVCSHLGCVVPWDADSKQFVCPCHKGVFAPDGTRLSGPPPRGLDPLPTKVENGTLYVQYQYYRQLSSKREVIG
ncbi:MAG: QcrA and Rieske domain-containing protein [Polyangia bacterium]